MSDRRYPNTERKTYTLGECVFSEGEFAGCAYIIESGSVDVMKDAVGGPVKVSTLFAGELFGEMALIGDSTRTATIKVVEKTVLLVVTPAALWSRLDAADPVVRRLITVLINRLRDQTEANASGLAEARAS